MLVLTDCTDLLRRGEANVVYCGFIVEDGGDCVVFVHDGRVDEVN